MGNQNQPQVVGALRRLTFAERHGKHVGQEGREGGVMEIVPIKKSNVPEGVESIEDALVELATKSVERAIMPEFEIDIDEIGYGWATDLADNNIHTIPIEPKDGIIATPQARAEPKEEKAEKKSLLRDVRRSLGGLIEAIGEQYTSIARHGDHIGQEGRKGKGAKGGSEPGFTHGEDASGVQAFDEDRERSSIMDMKPGGGGSPKEGISREQMQHFFNRRDATLDAAKKKYRDGSSVKDLVDQTFAEGFSEIERKQFGYVMRNPESGVTRRFKFKEERDYIDVLSSHGSFSINYEITERSVIQRHADED